jgi:predicted MFS family arabinose efflux permease
VDSDPLWLIPVQALDGLASGVIGVAVPVLVADATYGSGRTQTALGAVYSVQGAGGEFSHAFGGVLVGWLGWSGAFLALAAPAAAAFAMALWLQRVPQKEQPSPTRDRAGRRCET